MSFLPICEISPYGRKGWTIKARVSSRQPTRTFKRKTGEDGKVVNVDLLDAEGGEIRASLWNDAAEKFGDLLKAGKVYTFSGGWAKVANKKFTGLSHSYELSFDKEAVIAPVEDDVSISQVKLAVVQLRELAAMPVPCTVDVCVVVKECGDHKQMPTKRLTSVALRRLTVVCKSECSLEVALWDRAAMLDPAMLAPGTVLAIKGLKVSDYSGRNGSVSNPDSIHFDLDIPQIQEMKQWWAQNSGGELRALSSGETKGPAGETMSGSLAEFEVESAKLQEGQALYWNTKAYFAFLRTQREGTPIPLWYMACPTCSRKVNAGECLKCSKDVPNPDLRYMLTSFIIEDDSSQRWVSAFNEAAANLLGLEADKFQLMLGDGSIGDKSGVVDKQLRTRYFEQEYHIKLRAKVETFEGNSRLRAQVMTAVPVVPVAPTPSAVEADGAALLAELAVAAKGASPNALAEIRQMLQGTEGLGSLGCWREQTAAAASWAAPVQALEVACA